MYYFFLFRVCLPYLLLLTLVTRVFRDILTPDFECQRVFFNEG